MNYTCWELVRKIYRHGYSDNDEAIEFILRLSAYSDMQTYLRCVPTNVISGHALSLGLMFPGRSERREFRQYITKLSHAVAWVKRFPEDKTYIRLQLSLEDRVLFDNE